MVPTFPDPSVAENTSSDGKKLTERNHEKDQHGESTNWWESQINSLSVVDEDCENMGVKTSHILLWIGCSNGEYSEAVLNYNLYYLQKHSDKGWDIS